MSAGWLLGIKIPVTVSFGRARLRLEEVLKLQAGSVIELDRTPGDMVDLMVGGSLVARAEVVALDENYGLRIKEVVADRAVDASEVEPIAEEHP
jgi:flagellar motor switch protein FliN/FliY